MKTVSHWIGALFVWSRDQVAGGLVRIRITPNVLTVAGMAVTCSAAVMLGLGHWLIAGFLLVAAGAADMLDGAVARIAGKRTPFGGVLDSTCDRVGDFSLVAGLAYYYLVRLPTTSGGPPNLTYGFLAGLAAISSMLISYLRARAEPQVPSCDVGFWRRGERFAAVLIGSFAANPAIILWELGPWAALTALYRLLYVRQALGGRPFRDARPPWHRLVFFDEPRGSLAYDIHTGTAIALLIFLRLPEADPLRQALQQMAPG